MRRQLRTTVAALALLAVAGCDDSILDVRPKDQISEEMVFADASLADAFLTNIYNGVGTGINLLMLSSLSDESQFIHGWGTDRVVQALVTSSDAGAADPVGWCCRLTAFDWTEGYRRIRQANVFLSQIDGSKIDEARKQRMKGEALFLRAYFYHNLMRMYGGVPLITKVYGLNEEYDAPRNSFKETVDFIVKDADEAAKLLPASYSGADVGRVTKGAALALKSRTLLYSASDLFHRNPSGQPETGHTGAQDRQAHWRAAKNAARAVMDLGVYSLFRPNPSSPQEAAQNYGDLFLQKTSSEAIMSRFYVVTRSDTWDGYHPGLHNGPNGYHNWGSNSPIQNLIDDYLMADGTRFDWSNPAHAGAPYLNRDPRFYASILHDGAKWRERPSDVKGLDPVGIVQTFSALKLPDGTTVPGIDTRKGPVEDWNGSYSGYYLRKFIDPSVNHQFTRQEIPWIFFRYAEILLNYAEASIELNELGDAVSALNQIRTRAGMPALSAGMGQAALREAYRNERRIELAFEEHRYFDVRRWMTAPQVLGRNAFGIDITLEGASRLDRSTWKNYRYQVKSVQNRAWDNRMYFMPIQRDEMNRNKQLKQNPGY